MNRAVDFYINTLGLRMLNRYGDHYAEIDANGFVIGLHPASDQVTFGTNMSIGLGVFNFDDTVKELELKGIEFSHEQGGYIRLAHFKDPDGNQLFLAENT